MNSQISNDLFNKIRSKFANITIGDQDGSPTADPKEARFFDFEYQEDMDTFGRMSVSLAEDGVMKVYYNRDLADKIDEDSRSEFFAFLQELKQFAVQHQLGFDVRDITKSNLTKQDYKNLADANKTVNTDDMTEELNTILKNAGIQEGLTGTSKSSFENLDKTRLIIRHKGPVDENVAGARTRQINSLFIENEDGERFKYPIIHLAGARAMTRHVANGGRPHDEFGQHIIQTSEDIARLNSFSRYVAHKDQLNDSAGDIIELTKLKLENLRSYMKNLSKQSHYESSCKNYRKSEAIELDDETANSYKDKFTMKSLDDRVEEALPLIHQIVSEKNVVEGYEKEVINTIKNAGIDGFFNQGTLFINGGDDDIAKAKDELQNNSNINDLPKIEKDEKHYKEDDGADAPQIDHGAVVTSFLTDPNKKLVLRKDDAADKMLSVTKFTDSNGMLGSILGDIAARMMTKDGDDDRVANFASRVAVDIEDEGQPFHKQGPDYNKNKKIAVQLAKRYIDDYKRMQKDTAYKDQIRIDPADFNPKKDRQGKAKEDAFESWANRVVEGTWSLPTNKDDIEDLAALMKNHFDVGTDAVNATSMLGRIGFGDDSLYDELGSLYDREGERADVRPIIKNYVMQMLVPAGNYDGEMTPEIKNQLQKAVQGFKNPDDKQMDLPGVEKEPMFAGEQVTFEDIKPYVSMYSGDDGKTVYDVLDKDGKSCYKTQDGKTAMQYLSKNYDKLRKGEIKSESLQESRNKLAGIIKAKVDKDENAVNEELDRIVRLSRS